MNDKAIEWRVHMRSKPGFYEQYDGHVDVFARDAVDATEQAFKQIKRTFPERSRDMWRVMGVEVKAA